MKKIIGFVILLITAIVIGVSCVINATFGSIEAQWLFFGGMGIVWFVIVGIIFVLTVFVLIIGYIVKSALTW